MLLIHKTQFDKEIFSFVFIRKVTTVIIANQFVANGVAHCNLKAEDEKGDQVSWRTRDCSSGEYVKAHMALTFGSPERCQLFVSAFNLAKRRRQVSYKGS
mmetsp:Transcript_31079/g.68134  ORF Transcript_31079/g.68134 Transcript_31079/m.68134 type:complete len:100 (+) Transcript_31079:778-1077(+)